MESGLPGVPGLPAPKHVAPEQVLANVCVTIPSQPTAERLVEAKRMKHKFVRLAIVQVS